MLCEGMEDLKKAASAIARSYFLRCQIEKKSVKYVYEIAQEVVCWNHSALTSDELQDLLRQYPSFGIEYSVLERLIETVNQKFIQAALDGFKPEEVKVTKSYKLVVKGASGRRSHPALSAAIRNLNRQSFTVAAELMKVAFREGFSSVKAVKTIFSNAKEQLGNKLDPKLNVSMADLMNGNVNIQLQLVRGDVDPATLLRDPTKTAYKSLMAYIDSIKANVEELGKLKDKIEAVPSTIGGFDPSAALQEAASADILALPGMLHKAAGSASLAAGAPAVLEHTAGTAMAVIKDIELAFRDAFQGPTLLGSKGRAGKPLEVEV